MFFVEGVDRANHVGIADEFFSIRSIASFRPTLQRVFDEILKYEGRACLDRAAAFCNLADFDSCNAKAFCESRDGRTCSLMVARDAV
jgi:hypothetical protein